ncbi:MAG: hypothetical protein HYT37_02575 [Candidatus Sungbacteria bacterium]|nr:hypothetical protein [Candidatus Sungbacteria bacterium]
MARNKAKNNFILVAELKNRLVKKIIEAPSERKARKVRLMEIDAALVHKARELDKNFPAARYDVMILRASNIEVLKTAFPELSGWDQITPEKLLIEENI